MCVGIIWACDAHLAPHVNVSSLSAAGDGWVGFIFVIYLSVSTAGCSFQPIMAPFLILRLDACLIAHRHIQSGTDNQCALGKLSCGKNCDASAHANKSHDYPAAVPAAVTSGTRASSACCH
jgi:hypothetical protein